MSDLREGKKLSIRVKKKHTYKVQILIDFKSLTILNLQYEKGKIHDFKLFKKTRLPISPKMRLLADSGYQGIEKRFPEALIPVKKKKKQPLKPEEKAFNKKLSSLRIPVEHVIRRCKIFRILKETYRNSKKNLTRNWFIVAALVNKRYQSLI